MVSLFDRRLFTIVAPKVPGEPLVYLKVDKNRGARMSSHSHNHRRKVIAKFKKRYDQHRGWYQHFRAYVEQLQATRLGAPTCTVQDLADAGMLPTIQPKAKEV